jgi:phage gp29-like protein
MRAVLFWWLFATMDRDWWVRFLDRYGAPFIVGKYDQADDASRKTLVRAFSAATRLFGLVVSRDTEVQLNSVAAQGHGEAFSQFMEVANDELSRLILGQTMTSTAKAAGIGSSQAQVQDNVRGDIRAWDAACLAETVTQQIIRPWLDANGFTGEAVLTFGTTSTAEAGSRADVLSKASAAGLELTDDGITRFNEDTGLQFRRAVPPVSTPGAPAIQARPDPLLRLVSRKQTDCFSARAVAARQMSNEDLDRLAANAAPELADAFRGVYAPIRRIILESTSAADLEQRLQSFYADWTPARLQPILEDALAAFAANGAASAALPRP